MRDDDSDDVMIDEALADFRKSIGVALDLIAEALEPLIECSNDVVFLELTRQLDLVAVIAHRLRTAGAGVGQNTPASFLLEVLYQAFQEEHRTSAI